MRKFNVSKSVAAVLSAALLTMSLTACGSTASTASTEAASTAAASTEAASEAAVSSEAESEVAEESTEVEVEEESEAAETEASEEATTEEAEEVEEEETNTDITAGTADDDGSYSAYAVLGGTVDASVTALAADIKTNDFSSAKAIGDSGSTPIKDSRLTYLKAENDGDEDAAKDDLADYDDIERATDAQLAEIKKYSEDLGKLFAQFDITSYDFSTPYDSDSEYVEFDVYSSSGKLFLLDFYFSGDSLITIDFAEEDA